MLIKSFGCSFIYGSDLPDEPCLVGRKHSKLTWPARLADLLGYRYSCYAKPGVGNLHILNQILGQIDQDPCLFLIGWTFIDRFDYTSPNDSWLTLRPDSADVSARCFYKHLHSQYRDKLVTLLYINQCLDLLKKHGHKWIMTTIDDLIFESDWHHDAIIGYLQKNIQDCFYKWDGKNFLKWAQDSGYHASQRLHPDQHAHEAAAKHLFNNLKKVDTEWPKGF